MASPTGEARSVEGVDGVRYAKLIVARIDGWGFRRDGRRGELRLGQELLLSPYSDGEDELARMARYNFFDPVYFNLRSRRIAMEAERSYVSGIVVATP